MKCSFCGQEVLASEKFCSHCGQVNSGYESVEEATKETKNESYSSTIHSFQTNQTVKEEGKTLGVCAIIFSALGGWLGLILSIIGLVIYKRPENRKLCTIGICLCIFWFILGLFIGCLGA